MAYQEFYELPRHYRLKGKPILGICPGRKKPLAPPERERFAVFNLLVALFLPDGDRFRVQSQRRLSALVARSHGVSGGSLYSLISLTMTFLFVGLPRMHWGGQGQSPHPGQSAG